MNVLNEQVLQLTSTASAKMAELISQVDGEIAGIRVFSQAGGCSGMSFGMTFSERVEESDLVRENAELKVIIGADTIDQLRGTEIDYADNGKGRPSFCFQ